MLLDTVIEKKKIESLLKSAYHKSIVEAEIYIEYTKISTFEYGSDGKANIFEKLNSGAGIRFVQGEKIFYFYTSNLDYSRLKNIFSSLLNTTYFINKKQIPVLDSGRFMQKDFPDFCEIPSSKKMKFADDLLTVLMKNKNMESSKITLGNMQKAFIVGNFNTIVEGYNEYTYLHADCLFKYKNSHISFHQSLGGFGGWEFYSTFNIRSWLSKEVEVFVRELRSRTPSIKKSKIPVVISKGLTAVLNESIGHSLEADNVAISFLKNKKGKKIISSEVTIVNDPTIPFGGGSIPIDDEGIKTKRFDLIKDGILMNFIYDKFTALRDKTTSTGNGRRESYKYSPLPRMTNLILLPGFHSPEEIIKSVNYGLYVRDTGNAQRIDSKGTFSVSVRNGWLIENGKLTSPVQNVVLVSNTAEVLSNLEMIGNDYQINRKSIRCGKSGQWVYIGGGCPTFKIKSMLVGR